MTVEADPQFAVRAQAKIAYQVFASARGAAAPWLVLLQGLGFDSAGWDPVIEGLAGSFRLILVDNRGTGRSDPLPAVYSVPEMADDVVAVLDHAGIERAHLAGVSLGGMVAQHLAMHHPRRVRGLVLACTTPGWPRGLPMPMTSLWLIATTLDLSSGQALRRHVENMLSAETVRRRPDLVRRVQAHLRERAPTDTALTVLGSAGMRWFGGMGHSRILAPTLVLTGTADTVVDPRNSNVLAQAIPNSQLLMLPGRGHLFFWEDPEGTVAAIVAFLAPPDAVAGEVRETVPHEPGRQD